MKRLLFIAALVVLVCLPFCLGQITDTRVSPVMLSSPQSRWTEIGTITSQQAYPAVGDRDYTAVAALTDAATIVWDVPNWARKIQLSFQTSADADSTTIAMLCFADSKSIDSSNAVTLDDDAVYGGQIVLTGGKQVGKHSNVYVDTAVCTDGLFAMAALDSAADRRVVVETGTKGYKRIVFIATTLQAGSTLYAEGRIYQ